jgi:NADP-dependent 3-hydroxy acid dehydrogenase YdfG
MQIENRVFVVTGASSGIGASTAIALSRRGARVALLARTKTALVDLADKLPECFPFVVDMTDFDGVRNVI